MYYQVAVHFADLHDTPGRMQEKGVITVSTEKRLLQGFYSSSVKGRVPPLMHLPLRRLKVGSACFCRTSWNGRMPAHSSTGGCDGCCWKRW